jgi:hypothetical protein
VLSSDLRELLIASRRIARAQQLHILSHRRSERMMRAGPAAARRR